VILPLHMPSSVNSVSGMDVGDMVPESTDSIVSPETSVVAWLSMSWAVMVTGKLSPATPVSGASTSKPANACETCVNQLVLLPVSCESEGFI
jgi:hypothetical protein